MEEREYFRELCMGLLEAYRNIRFAGVINDNGKPLVGEYRKDIESPLIKPNQLIDSRAMSNSSSTGGITKSSFLRAR